MFQLTRNKYTLTRTQMPTLLNMNVNRDLRKSLNFCHSVFFLLLDLLEDLFPPESLSLLL